MNKESQSIFELIRMFPTRREPGISDTEADALYKLWLGASPGSSKIKASSDIKDLRSLIAKGYIRQSGVGMEITDKGRQIIVEMVTHAPNALDKSATMPTYKDIKSRVARSGKQTFTKRAERDKKVYNHHKRGCN